MEYIDILDEKGNKTGKSKPYPEIHRDGDWHRAVHIWFINSKNEILLQRRSETMKIYPNMWCASASGHVSKGEDEEISAIREIKEEVGTDIAKEELKLIGEVTKQEILNNGTFFDSEFNNVYLVKKDLDISKLKTSSEVQSLNWVPIAVFKKMVQEGNSDLISHPDEYSLFIKNSRKSMIKAVIFDIDGVLIDSFEANFKFFYDLLTHFGHNPPTREEFPALFHRPMKDIIVALAKGADEKEIEKIWLAGRDHTVPYPANLVVQPTYVKEALESLSKEYSLGIVTSRTTFNIYQLPQLVKIKQYFKAEVGYEETENHKPHPDPLILVANKLGVLPEECVYVGDAENDVIAAKAAGMKSVIYFKDKLANADANFVSFEELPDIIKSI